MVGRGNNEHKVNLSAFEATEENELGEGSLYLLPRRVPFKIER